MGCCGCDNKASVTTAGILGLIQAGVGLIFNIYFLALYFGFRGDQRTLDGEQAMLLSATYTSSSLIKGLLLVATVLHTSWIISSVAVLIGNCKDHPCSIRQWVVVTSLIIIGDLIFPPILIANTINIIKEIGDTLEHRLESEESEHVKNEIITDAVFALYKYYIILVLGFCRLGLISLITNICLCIFTSKRVTELVHPTTGYVLATVPMTQSPGAVQVYPVMQQQGYPPQQVYPMLPQTCHPEKPQPADPNSYNSKF